MELLEMSNRELLHRMHMVEESMIKIQDELPHARTGTPKSQWLIEKWHVVTAQYADVVREANTRGLITVH